jgi:hypothetical protein
MVRLVINFEKKRGLDSEKIFFVSANKPYDDQIFNCNS